MTPHQMAHRTRIRRAQCIVPVLSNPPRHYSCAGNPPLKTLARTPRMSRLPGLPRTRTCRPRGIVLGLCILRSTCILSRRPSHTSPTSTEHQHRSPPPWPLSKPRRMRPTIHPHTHTPQTVSTSLDHCMFPKRCTKCRSLSRSILGCRIRMLPPRLLHCSGMTRPPDSCHDWSTSLARIHTRNLHQRHHFDTRCSLLRCMNLSTRSSRPRHMLLARCSAPWNHTPPHTGARSSLQRTSRTCLPSIHVHIRRPHPPDTSRAQSMRTSCYSSPHAGQYRTCRTSHQRIQAHIHSFHSQHTFHHPCTLCQPGIRACTLRP